MQRNVYLDMYRGFSLVSMAAFHGYYDLVFVFGFWPHYLGSSLYNIWQQTIVLSFIFIAGASTCYSKKLWRHGVQLELLGLAITLVTMLVLPSELIIFGVLSFLGTSLLLLVPFQKKLTGLNTTPLRLQALAVLCVVGFGLTQGLSRGYIGLYGWRLLDLSSSYVSVLSFSVGLPTQGIISADYVPLLPHFFIFLLGRVLWQYHLLGGAMGEQKNFFSSRLAQPFIWLGRHSLGFYLVHQIILYGICKIIGLFR